MKVRASATPICKDCQVVIRRNGQGKKTRRVVCPNRRHNQRQG